uniref:Uncharacterized protein n=1 Tax=Anguilla anguilla TaxID=7936 RepID=A0A0E9UFU9_ANGAN
MAREPLSSGPCDCCDYL